MKDRLRLRIMAELGECPYPHPAADYIELQNKIMKFKHSFNWNKHPDMDIWFYEDNRSHVAGSVELKNGVFVAGVAIPYDVDEDGNEKDWEVLGEFDDLDSAKSNVQVAACWTVQGEFLYS